VRLGIGGEKRAGWNPPSVDDYTRERSPTDLVLPVDGCIPHLFRGLGVTVPISTLHAGANSGPAPRSLASWSTPTIDMKFVDEQASTLGNQAYLAPLPHVEQSCGHTGCGRWHRHMHRHQPYSRTPCS
jgi:hypothetical protein